MNRMSIVQKSILAALLVAMLSITLSTPAAAGPAVGWLSLWGPTANGCAFTFTVQWAHVNGAKTLEIWLEENGTPIAPIHVEPVNGKSGTVTYTFPSLASSTTMNLFRGWAQLLDTHGNSIPGTLDFSGNGGFYCTAP